MAKQLVKPGLFGWLVLLAAVIFLASGSNFFITAVYAGGALEWEATGELNTGRAYHTTIRLSHGQVLVIGGKDASGPLSSCELYDPATRKFTPTNPLNTARYQQTATQLNNGSTLVVGGMGTDGVLNSTEFFPPEITQPWIPSASLQIGRRQHYLTFEPILNIGMVSGGETATGTTNTCERYYPDPSQGNFPPQWNFTGSMHYTRRLHTLTPLRDGRLLAIGGCGTGGLSEYRDTCETYDLETEEWTLTDSLQKGRFEHTATLLKDGKVLVAGGLGASGAPNSAEVYDPATGLWTPTGSLNTGRWLHTATLLKDGKVLVAGGWKDAGPLNSAELYDPAKGTWTPTGSLNAARDWHTATLLDNGDVLVVGGYTGSAYLNSAEIYRVPHAMPQLFLLLD